MKNLFSYDAALGFKQVSLSVQKVDSQMFIETEVCPQAGDSILDLGCGTGELSAYLAENVRPQGKVVGVDPDKERILLAQQSYNGVKNLSFVEGGASNFPVIGSESYDIILSNYAIHWIPDKQQLCKNMFEGLKDGGKIAIQYSDYIFVFLYPALTRNSIPKTPRESIRCIITEKRPKIELYCSSVGFRISKSYDTHNTQQVFQTTESLRNWIWSSTHGAFDLTLVTEERLQRYYPYSSRDGKPPFDFRGIQEESRVCRLVAVKQGPGETETVHKHSHSL